MTDFAKRFFYILSAVAIAALVSLFLREPVELPSQGCIALGHPTCVLR